MARFGRAVRSLFRVRQECLLTAQCRLPHDVDAKTRRQLLSLNTDFYLAHAAGFDASRGHQPWPGWQRLLEWLPDPEAGSGTQTPLSVLDVGCGNARLASYLSGAGFSLDYVGVDSNAGLLMAARHRLAPELARQVELVQGDFLATDCPGESLPEGPFAFVALFGVLHHVPGRDSRLRLLRALAERTRPGGMLALAAWQFAGRDRFARRAVGWRELGPVLGEKLDTRQLEAGDALLRFGSNPDLPPRYCHQVADAELDCIAEDLGQFGLELQGLGDFRADGSEGDLNRYLVLRRRRTPTAPG